MSSTVLLRLGLAAVTALALAAPPAAATAGVFEEGELDPAAEFLMAKYQIDEAEAVRRGEVQNAVDLLVDDVESALGESYGGVWIDQARGGVAKIGALPGQEATLRDFAARRGVDAVVVPVVRSLAQLRAIQEHLIATLPADTGLQVGGLYTPTNQVNVSLKQPPPGQPGFAGRAELIARLSTNHPGQLRFRELEGAQTDLACVRAGGASPNTWCDAPIRGGVGISSGPRRCSAGFNVRSRTDGARYLITAGHCSWGEVWQTRNADSTTVRDVGFRHNAINDPRADAMIIRLNSQHQSAQRPWVFVTGQGGTTRNESYLIAEVGRTVIGMAVCMTGRRDGTQCGEVSDTDHPGAGAGPAHVAEVTGGCIRGGDSGGAVYRFRRAPGIVESGLHPLDENGNPDTNRCSVRWYYQGLTAAMQLLNVRLVTVTNP